MDVKSVYYETELQSRINIRPNQMVPGMNVTKTLLNNLKQDVEKKCTADYYVVSVNKITYMEEGMIDRHNSTAHAIYLVRYSAYICSPTKGQNIVVMYDSAVPDKLLVKNDPIYAFVSHDEVPKNIFGVENNNIIYKAENRPIGKDDYLVVQVERTEFVQNSRQIIVKAKLLNVASEKEIKLYKKQQQNLLDPDIKEMDGEFI